MKEDLILEAFHTSLEVILKEGTRKLSQETMENELKEYLETQQHVKDDIGRRLVKKNDYLLERKIQTGIGNIEVKKSRDREAHR